MNRSRAATRSPRILGAFALLVVTACKGEETETEETHAAVSVRIATVTAQPFTETISAIGDVVPRAGHVAALSAPAPTRVARVNVVAGQHVNRGAALVELEQATFVASAQSAQAALDAAQRNYDRAQRLVDAGVSPRRDLEQAASDLAQARANVVAAQRARELSVLRAPFSGVVTVMNAVLGGSVDVNQVLVEIADPNALDVLLEATPAEAARVRAGATVDLHAGGSATGESLGKGTVVDVGGAVDTATRSVALRVRASSLHRTLRIGETVSGEVTVATYKTAIVVPNDALVPEGEAFKVFVVDSADVAHARPVNVGARRGDQARILSGLSAGERVVTYGAYGLEDGAKVLPEKP